MSFRVLLQSEHVLTLQSKSVLVAPLSIGPHRPGSGSRYRQDMNLQCYNAANPPRSTPFRGESSTVPLGESNPDPGQALQLPTRILSSSTATALSLAAICPDEYFNALGNQTHPSYGSIAPPPLQQYRAYFRVPKHYRNIQ
jgi:hypothetical protein